MNTMKPSGKASHLPVEYLPTGQRQIWRIWREQRMYNTTTKTSAPSWCWEDSEGYVRCGPETWAEFVPYLRSYFESYAVKPLVDFS